MSKDYAGKPTNAEQQKRISVVYGMLLNGASRRDIVEYCRKNWNVNRWTADTLISEATREISVVTEEERNAMYGKAVKRLENLYMRCINDGDKRTALAVQRELNEIAGLKLEQKSSSSVNEIRIIVPNSIPEVVDDE